MNTNIQELRRTNLRALIAQWSGPARLAGKLGVTSSYLSQLSSGHRPLTEKTARKFEGVLSLPTGWFDSHQAESVDKPAAIDQALVSRVVQLIGELAEEANVRLPPAKLADVVILAYEHAARENRVDESFIRRLITLTK